MGGLLALFDSISKIVERVIPDKAAQDAAKAQLAQSMAAGEFQQALAETQAAAQIITAEAQSQSWLARNVRPLCLLAWAAVITLHQAAPVVVRLFQPGFRLDPLDPWVFKLTAIGFTGYVTARTWEKVKDAE